jgi:CDP-glucose 4,6-dehydratase
MADPDFWRGRRVFLTGHTGFKGTWLLLWLASLGAKVTGFSLPPRTRPSLFTLCGAEVGPNVYGDIADHEAVLRGLADADPEVVIHMAAQALVRPSYVDPLGTFASNVTGTANLLQACRALPELKAILVVTSDKVYENDGAGRPFVEEDALGGHDPYSASKACAEIVTASFARSFYARRARVGTARAGNVIGGGDWSPFRIVTDLVAARQGGTKVELRYPTSVRPWQHVLEPLSGYLAYAEALAEGREGVPASLNFGPDPESFQTVSGLVEAFTARWGGAPGWTQAPGQHPHEASLLTLSAEKARATLGWRPMLGFDETVAWTADWYAAFDRREDVTALTRRQIAEYSARLSASAGREPLRRSAGR